MAMGCVLVLTGISPRRSRSRPTVTLTWKQTKKSTTTPALEHPNPPFAHPMRWMPRAAAIHVSPAFLTEEFVVRPYHAALFQCASTEGRRADRLLKIATVSGDRELVRADSPLLRYFGFRAFARTDVASVHRGSR
mmetsp:Transcript_34910/g.107775  ORF Transcript_34910/g.107775 Transcript_34910/m.107775 type:complete len:135 (-) Transcript_34910:103-507(-)